MKRKNKFFKVADYCVEITDSALCRLNAETFMAFRISIQLCVHLLNKTTKIEFYAQKFTELLMSFKSISNGNTDSKCAPNIVLETCQMFLLSYYPDTLSLRYNLRFQMQSRLIRNQIKFYLCTRKMKSIKTYNNKKKHTPVV